MNNTKMVMRMELSEKGILKQIQKMDSRITPELLADLRVMREVEQKIIEGMANSFKEQGKEAYCHNVGLNISLILLGEMDGKDMAKELTDDMIGLIDSFEFAIEGSDLYDHYIWTAENVYTKLN